LIITLFSTLKNGNLGDIGEEMSQSCYLEKKYHKVVIWKTKCINP